MNQIRTGIIGFGVSGRVFQAPFITVHPAYQLRKICSSRSKEINQLYPKVEVVSNTESVLNDPDIDLVVIASPNTEHFQQTKTALLNNKHVIVEKPFVTDIQEGNELIELAKQKEKVLTVYQNRRWDGDFKTVREIVSSGVLGEISEYEAHFDRFRPVVDNSNWRSHDLPGSGVLFDLGPHLIDQAIVLFGMPEAVFGDIRITRPGGKTDDAFEIILFYKHLRVKIKAAMLVKELGPHYCIHGSKGSFVKFGLDPQENLLKQGAIPNGANWGADDEKLNGTLNIIKEGSNCREIVKTKNGNYMGFFDNVADVILAGKPLAVKPETALQNIQIIRAALESSRQQKVLKL
jgi:scyllo-inositol 2-dehydrogenase (NADP+)